MTSAAKTLVLGVVAVVGGLALSAHPWALVRAERADAADQIRRAEIDEARMVRDRSREARLGTELGKEEVVRGQGMIRAGERSLTP